MTESTLLVTVTATNNSKSGNGKKTCGSTDKNTTTSTAFEKKWYTMYSRLMEYKIKNGNCLVPDKWKDDPKLATWVGTQRNQYQKNKLSQDRINKLNIIGFQWNALESKWNEMFIQLQKYKEDNGHCNVPVNNYKANPKLGKWVNTIRRKYVCNTLSKEQIDKLEGIGFVFRVNMPIQTFNEMYTKLVEYKTKHGNCCVSKDNQKLYNWCSNQQYKKRKGTLPAYQEKLLNDINFFASASSSDDRNDDKDDKTATTVTTNNTSISKTKQQKPKDATKSTTVTPTITTKEQQQEEIEKLQREIEQLQKLKQKQQFNINKRKQIIVDDSFVVDSLLQLRGNKRIAVSSETTTKEKEEEEEKEQEEQVHNNKKEQPQQPPTAAKNHQLNDYTYNLQLLNTTLFNNSNKRRRNFY